VAHLLADRHCNGCEISGRAATGAERPNLGKDRQRERSLPVPPRLPPPIEDVRSGAQPRFRRISLNKHVYTLPQVSLTRRRTASEMSDCERNVAIGAQNLGLALHRLNRYVVMASAAPSRLNGPTMRARAASIPAQARASEPPAADIHGDRKYKCKRGRV
jgi:hypothetical protein